MKPGANDEFYFGSFKENQNFVFLVIFTLSINLSCLRQMFRSGPLKGGLQEKMYFLLGCVRCAAGKYNLIDRECDFQRKVFKNQILHDIFMENSRRYEK